MSSIGRNSAVSLGFRALSVLVTLATTVVLARALGAAGQGIYSSVIFLWTLVVTVVGFGLPSVNSIFAGRLGYSIDRLIWNSLWFVIFGMVVTLALAGGMALIPELAIPQLPRVFVQFALLSAPIGVAAAALGGLVWGRNRVQLWASIAFLASAATLVSAFLLVAVGHLGLIGALAAWLVGQLAIVTAAGRYALSEFRLPIRFESGLLREAAWFGLRINLSQLVGVLNFRFDTLLVLTFLGASAVGLYTVTVLLSQALFLVPSALATALLPVLSSAPKERAGIVTRQAMRLSLLFSVVGAVGLAIAGPILLSAFGKQYPRAWLTLLVLLPGVVSYSLVHITSVYWDSYARKPQINLTIAGLSLVIDVVAAVLLMRALGIVGAGIAATLGYFTAAALSLYLYLRDSSSDFRDAVIVEAGDFLALRRLLPLFSKLP